MDYTEELEAARQLLEEALKRVSPVKPAKGSRKPAAAKMVFTGPVMIGQFVQNFADSA